MISNKKEENSSFKVDKLKNFLSRTLSTILLIICLFVIFFISNPFVYAFIIIILSNLALREYFKLYNIKFKSSLNLKTTIHILSIIYFIVNFLPLFIKDNNKLLYLDYDGIFISILLLVIFVHRIYKKVKIKKTFNEITSLLFGFIYCVILFGFIAKILTLPLLDVNGNNSSHFYIIFLLIITKLTDVGAYIIGSLFGKNKMIPKLSPGKTWEGFGGAILIPIIGGYLFLFFFKNKTTIIEYSNAWIITIICSLVAMAGDLMESLMKRRFFIKDSGKIIPGIGGVLDLLDSIIVTAPLFYLYLYIQSHI